MPEKQRPKVSRYDLVSGVDTYATQTSQDAATSRFMQAWIPGDDGGLYREWNDPLLATGLPIGAAVKRLFEFDWYGPNGVITRFFYAVAQTAPGANTYNLYSLIPNVLTVSVSQVYMIGNGTMALQSLDNISIGMSLTIDTGVNQEVVTVLGFEYSEGVHHIPIGIIAVFTKTHAIGVPVAGSTSSWQEVAGVGTLANIPSFAKVQDGSLLHLSDGITNWMFDGFTWLADGLQIPQAQVAINVVGSWRPNTIFPVLSLITDSNGDLQVAVNGGTSGYTMPTWATSVNPISAILLADATAGSNVTISVDNTDNFTIGAPIQIGNLKAIIESATITAFSPATATQNGSLTVAALTYNHTAGEPILSPPLRTTDGDVVWQNASGAQTWEPNTLYPDYTVIFNANSSFMIVRPGTGGTYSGSTVPVWLEYPGYSTVDNVSGPDWYNFGKFVRIGNAGGASNTWTDMEWHANSGPGGTPPDPNYPLGSIVIDTNGNLQQVVVSGTNGTTMPQWNSIVGGTTVDGGVTWNNLGLIANLVAWQQAAPYVTKYAVIIDSNGYFQQVTAVGTSGENEPAWRATYGATTSDGSITWTNIGSSNVGPPPQANIGKYYWYTVADETIPRVHESTSSAISLNSGPLNYQEVDVYPLPGSINVGLGQTKVTITPFPVTIYPGPLQPLLGTWCVGLGLFGVPTSEQASNLIGIIASVDPSGTFLTLEEGAAYSYASFPIDGYTGGWWIGDARATHIHIYQSESDGSRIGQLSNVTPAINSNVSANAGTTGIPIIGTTVGLPSTIPFADFSEFIGGENTTIDAEVFRPVRNDPTPSSLLAETHKYRIFRRRETQPNLFNFTANEEVTSGLNGDAQECVPGASLVTLSDIVDEQQYPDASVMIRAMTSHGDALYIGTERNTIPLYGSSIDDFGLSQVSAFSVGIAGRFAMISTAHGLVLVSYDKKVFIYPTSNYYWAYVPNDVNVTDNMIEIGKPLRKILELLATSYLDETQLTFYFYNRRNWLVLTFRDITGAYQTWVYDFFNKGWFELASGYSSTAVFEISPGEKILVGGSPAGGVYVLDDLTGTYTSTGNQPQSVWRPALIDFGDPDSSHIPLYLEFEFSNPLMANDMTINYYLDPPNVDSPGTPRQVIFAPTQIGANKYRGFFQGGNLCQRLLIEFNAAASPVATNSGYMRGIKLVADTASGLVP
jgi:hypothetical protein